MRIVSIPETIATNPYQKLFYGALSGHNVELVKSFPLSFGEIWRRRKEVDVIHIHWMPASEDSLLKGYYRSLRSFLQLLLCRMLGIKIVWTAHNLFPHDYKFYGVQYFQRFWLVRLCNIILVHFEGAKAMLSRKFLIGTRKMITVHHGIYDQCYPNTVSRKDARDHCHLGDRQTVFLYFGLIRPYKNLEAVIGAFKKVQDPNAMLMIVGSVINDEYKSELISMVNDERIKCEFSFVKDEDIQYYFNAADCVILPYKNIFTSGSALLALTFKKPIIMKKCDFSVEYLSSHPAHILLDECEENEILVGLQQFLNNKGLREITDQDIQNFKWPYIGDRLIKDKCFQALSRQVKNHYAG